MASVLLIWDRMNRNQCVGLTPTRNTHSCKIKQHRLLHKRPKIKGMDPMMTQSWQGLQICWSVLLSVWQEYITRGFQQHHSVREQSSLFSRMWKWHHHKKKLSPAFEGFKLSLSFKTCCVPLLSPLFIDFLKLGHIPRKYTGVILLNTVLYTVVYTVHNKGWRVESSDKLWTLSYNMKIYKMTALPNKAKAWGQGYYPLTHWQGCTGTCTPGMKVSNLNGSFKYELF